MCLILIRPVLKYTEAVLTRTGHRWPSSKATSIAYTIVCAVIPKRMVRHFEHLVNKYQLSRMRTISLKKSLIMSFAPVTQVQLAVVQLLVKFGAIPVSHGYSSEQRGYRISGVLICLEMLLLSCVMLKYGYTHDDLDHWDVKLKPLIQNDPSDTDSDSLSLALAVTAISLCDAATYDHEPQTRQT